MQKVKLLRPLDGKFEGDTAEYPELDAKRLIEAGVVELAEEKQASAPENKAEPAASNKAAAKKKAD